MSMHPVFAETLAITDGLATLRDPAAARHHAETLARLAVFGDTRERDLARYVIMAAAHALGAPPASILPLYHARGRGEVSGFTVPAVNVRGLTFDTARAMFRAMAQSSCAAAVFELNRAEVGFTSQEPAEFAACVLAAAIAEGHQGPVFLQGDHVQFNRQAFGADPAAETEAVEDLVRRMVAAAFCNIDIDASTLVDLSFPTVAEQQATNARLTAHIAGLVRALAPEGVEISIGGEIGEVGAHNSTVDELVSYLHQVAALSGAVGHGLSKVSVQTGTKHGGIPLPGGGMAEVALDFDALASLGVLARDRYGMAGAVQHGASTLPDELFDRFPASETAEVHLATGFQDIVFDHPAFPAPLLDAMREHALAAFAAERSTGQTDHQFFYRARRRLWGPYKAELWALPPDVRGEIAAALEARFVGLFERLRVAGSREMVLRYVRPSVRPPAPFPV